MDIFNLREAWVQVVGRGGGVMHTVDWERGEVRPHSGFTRNLTASGGAHLRLHWVPDRPHLRPSLSLYVRYAVAHGTAFSCQLRARSWKRKIWLR